MFYGICINIVKMRPLKKERFVLHQKIVNLIFFWEEKRCNMDDKRKKKLINPSEVCTENIIRKYNNDGGSAKNFEVEI